MNLVLSVMRLYYQHIALRDGNELAQLRHGLHLHGGGGSAERVHKLDLELRRIAGNLGGVLFDHPGGRLHGYRELHRAGADCDSHRQRGNDRERQHLLTDRERFPTVFADPLDRR